MMPYCVDCNENFKRPANKPYLVRCYNCYVRWKDYCDSYDPTSDNVVTEFVDKFGVQNHIKQLIQLCHPDKHGNSKSSNDVTAWLLKIPRK